MAKIRSQAGRGTRGWAALKKTRDSNASTGTENTQAIKVQDTDSTSCTGNAPKLTDTQAVDQSRAAVQEYLEQTTSAIVDVQANYQAASKLLNLHVQSIKVGLNDMMGVINGGYLTPTEPTKTLLSSALKQMNAYNSEFGTNFTVLSTSVSDTICIADIQSDIKKLKDEIASITGEINKEQGSIQTERSELATIQLELASDNLDDTGDSIAQWFEDALAAITSWIPFIDLLTLSLAGQNQQSLDMRSEDIKTLKQELTELTAVSSDAGKAIGTLQNMQQALIKLVQTLQGGISTALASSTGGIGTSACTTEIQSLQQKLTTAQGTIDSDNTVVQGYLNSQGVANKLFQQLAAYLVIHNMLCEYDIHGSLSGGLRKNTKNGVQTEGLNSTKNSNTSITTHGGRDAVSIIKTAIAAYEKKFGSNNGNLKSAESFLTETLNLSPDGTSLTTSSSGFDEDEFGGIATNGSGAFTSSGSFASRKYDGYDGDSYYSSLGWEFDDKS